MSNCVESTLVKTRAAKSGIRTIDKRSKPVKVLKCELYCKRKRETRMQEEEGEAMQAMKLLRTCFASLHCVIFYCSEHK